MCDTGPGPVGAGRLGRKMAGEGLLSTGKPGLRLFAVRHRAMIPSVTRKLIQAGSHQELGVNDAGGEKDGQGKQRQGSCLRQGQDRTWRAGWQHDPSVMRSEENMEGAGDGENLRDPPEIVRERGVPILEAVPGSSLAVWEIKSR